MVKKNPQLETLGWKQIVLFLVLPALLSVVLFYLVFEWKEQELVRYRHPGWRIALIVIAAITGFLSGMMLWAALVVKLLSFFGFDVTKKGSAASFIFAGSVFLFIAPALYTGISLAGYNDQLEQQALARHGIGETAIITHYQRGRSKRSYFYQYFFNLKSATGKTFEEYVTRDHHTLEVGDRISVFYLKANPNIYREAE